MENNLDIDIMTQGIEKGYISLSEDKSTIIYCLDNIKRNYQKPEEKVQVQTFLKLIFKYNYPANRIKQFVKVTVGSETKEADMIIYNDDDLKQPYIVVECKKNTVTEQEFQQAVNQAFSYAHATAGTLKYVWVTSGIKDVYFKFNKEKDERDVIPDIPQFGVTKIAPYKFVKGGKETKDGQKFFPLEPVSQSELTDKFKQAHQALWGGGELNPSEAFDELDKLIFCKIYDEKKDEKIRKNGEPYDFQIIVVPPENDSKEAKEKADRETSQRLLKRMIALYEEGREMSQRKNDPVIFKDDIKLSAEKVRTVVGYLEGVDLLKTDLDSKGRAFETFMGSFFRGDFGQYFTPRPIVSFIVDTLPINSDSRILDTSCGSGGFLLHALDKVRKQATDFYPDYETNPDSREYWRKYWHDFAENNLYGIEINAQIARTAKMNMIIHDDGHTNVVSADGLLSPEDLCEKTGNKHFKRNSFDFILTNPPFGSTIKQTEKAYMKNYGLSAKEVDWLNPSSKQSVRPSQNTEVLFIEQAENYLDDGKYLAIVVPDGILTNSSMQYVRDYIAETFRIVAVVSMPQTAFTATGAGVKSSVMFLKKYSKEEKEYRQNTKLSLQHELISGEEGKLLLELIDKRKKKISEYNKRIRKAKDDELEQLEKEKLEFISEIDKRIEKMKENLTDTFENSYKDKLDDYPIFMAIAEDIGYDATGKETGNNELIEISKELSKFIEAIEKCEDSFFR